MTEPEQWAVTEADIEGTPDWAFSLASTIVLGNYGCGHAAVLIQRAFEDQTRKLRETALEALKAARPFVNPHTFPGTATPVREKIEAAITALKETPDAQ